MKALDIRVTSVNIVLLHLVASEDTRKQIMKVLDILVISANMLLLQLVI